MAIEQQFTIIGMERTVKMLRQLPRAVRYEKRRDALMSAGNIFVKLIQGKIKDSDGPHVRVTKGGKKTTYYPGNLRKSIQILAIKSAAVFVGPKFLKRPRAKSYGKGKRTDAWYAHFYEWGTILYNGREPVGKSFRQGSGLATRVIEQKIKKAFNDHIKKIKF